ncbi:MAG: hypothetical protein ACFE0S_00925 [Rhodospirillales bacterium]
MTAGPDPVLRQLHIQYGELALRKSAEGNLVAARHFDVKAARAADGERVRPDRPDDQDAVESYDRVISAIADDADAPAVRARAQVMFDCWIDERAQGVDVGDIEACKQELDRALFILTGGAHSGGGGAS